MDKWNTCGYLSESKFPPFFKQSNLRKKSQFRNVLQEMHSRGNLRKSREKTRGMDSQAEVNLVAVCYNHIYSTEIAVVCSLLNTSFKNALLLQAASGESTISTDSIYQNV